MRKYVALFLALTIIFPSTGNAQRRRNIKKPVKEEVQENPLVTQMLEAVQKIMFIDSMVVEKASFYSHIPLSKECGQIMQKDGAGQYTNELDDHRIQAVYNSDTTTLLASSDLIAGQWTTPEQLKGIGNDPANYPYIMPDGTTLYYAQKGEKSLGGYDIFVTRYNAENSSFLRPENIGMPFASEANDYLYVIDEPWQLGYFVTDRRQPKGMVCIYVFVPETSRRVYASEAYTPEQLRSLAAITRIADTWGDGKQRKEALERLDRARKAYNIQQQNANDGEVKQTVLEKARQNAKELKTSLSDKRKQYAAANDNEKAAMRQDILNKEKELENTLHNIRKMEKEERNRKYGK